MRLLRSFRILVGRIDVKCWVYVHGDVGRVVLFHGQISPTDEFGKRKNVRVKAEGQRARTMPLGKQPGVVRGIDFPELHDVLMKVLDELLRRLGIPWGWIHTVELIRVLGGAARQRYHKDQARPSGGGGGNLNFFLCLSKVGQSTLAKPAGATSYYSWEVYFGDVWYCSARVPHAGPGHAGVRSGPERLVLFVSIGPASSDEVVEYLEEIQDWKIATGNPVYEPDRTGFSNLPRNRWPRLHSDS